MVLQWLAAAWSAPSALFFFLELKSDETLGQGDLGFLRMKKLQSERIMYFPSFSNHHFCLKTLGRR